VSRPYDREGVLWEDCRGPRQAQHSLEDPQYQDHQDGAQEASPDSFRVATRPQQEDYGAHQAIAQNCHMGPEGWTGDLGKVVENGEEGPIQVGCIHSDEEDHGQGWRPEHEPPRCSDERCGSS